MLFQNLKKPPIYLPELRERKDVWQGQASNALLPSNSKGQNSNKTVINNHKQLKGNKNWFLVPQK